MLKFITGNKGKLVEMKEILSPIKIEHLNIDLDEIQEIDPRKIIRHKVRGAIKHGKKHFFVEDTCGYFDGLSKNLPGPFIKWFLKELGPEGLYGFAKKLRNTKVRMQTIIAYAKNSKEIIYFEGEIKGKLVKSRGKHGFGIDPVFQPNGSSMTLSELKAKGDFSFSSRGKAAKKFKKYLLSYEK